MSSSCERQGRLFVAPEIDPPEPLTGRIRVAIAARRAGLAAKHPAAVALAADVLAAVALPLRGVAALLAGVHTPRHWLRMLAGERGTPLEDFARLATDPTREARAAFLAGLSVLAAAVGYVVVPAAAPAPSFTAANAAFCRSASTLQSCVIEATADGVVADAERQEIDRLCSAADRDLEALRARARVPR